jgi:hypothetical protein
MNDITIQKLSKAQKESIRWLYLGNYEVTDIAAKLNIEPETVRFFIFGVDGKGESPTSLYQIKRKMSSTAISSFLIDRASVLDRIAGVTANIISKGLDDLNKQVLDGSKELNVVELKTLTDILGNLDKIVRLETGKATEHVQHLGLTVAEARELLQADPFAVEAEFKEIETKLPWLDKEGEV